MELPVIAPVQTQETDADLLLPPLRRGWLRHGNRPGDYAKAPRCGARARAGGCCRQPAMRNGRCRMHGGLSTGPRTAEGLDRSRRARWKHGFCSAETRELRRTVAQACRDLAAATRLARTLLRQRRSAHGRPAGARPAAARPASSGAGASSLGMGFIERISPAAGWPGGALDPVVGATCLPAEASAKAGGRPSYTVWVTGDRRSPQRDIDRPIPNRCPGVPPWCPS
jgi:hypothetical protein